MKFSVHSWVQDLSLKNTLHTPGSNNGKNIRGLNPPFSFSVNYSKTPHSLLHCCLLPSMPGIFGGSDKEAQHYLAQSLPSNSSHPTHTYTFNTFDWFSKESSRWVILTAKRQTSLPYRSLKIWSDIINRKVDFFFNSHYFCVKYSNMKTWSTRALR